MSVRVVVPPKPILDWETVKPHLRGVPGEDEQALVEGYIAAATAWIDGPHGWLARCIGVQTLELVTDTLCNQRLPFGPVVSIESVIYRDRDGDDRTVPDGDYRLLADGTIYSERWPSVGSGPDGVRIRYVAGYPDREETPEGGGEPVTVSTVPAPIRQAIQLLVGQWYDNREAVSVGAAPAAMPFAVEALLAPFRIWR